ncbi:MAG: HEAT repeat domain-containing protein, partial [Vicinamibacteria bacterium]
MSRFKLLGLTWLLITPISTLRAQETPVDASFLLESESPPSPKAIRVLVDYGGSLGVSSLLSAIDRIGPEERRIVAESFRGSHAEQERVFDALFRLAQDEAAPVREAAIDSLWRSKSIGGGLTLLRLIDAGYPDREALAKAVHRFAYRRRQEEVSGAGDFEEHAVRSLEPLLTDSSTPVRYETVQALSYFSHPRAEDLLLSVIDDSDANTRYNALLRVLPVERFLEPLLSHARSISEPETRRELLYDIGYAHCG